MLEATSELLAERGLGSFSIDEVVRRSGVAKTTIYRHWPSRAGLVVDACSQIAGQPEVPNAGSFREDVAILIRDLARLLREARWSSVLPSIIDAAERDDGLAEVHAKIQVGHATPFRAVVERAILKGELPANVDVSALVASLLGPLFYRRWFSREPLDEAFVEGVIRNARSWS